MNEAALWHAAVAKVLRGTQAETLAWRTTDGLAFEPLYAAHAGGIDQPAGRLGAAPWRIGQRLDHPDPAEAKAQAREDLAGGATALTVVLAGAPSGRGFGVELRSAEALEEVLAGLELPDVEVRFDPGHRGFDLAAMVTNLAGTHGPSLGAQHLDLGIDPVGMLATGGALPSPWPEVAGDMVATLSALRERGFTGRAFRADGRPWHEAGASEAQELGGVLASAVLMLRALEAGGVDLEAARGAISFTLAADTDLVLTSCKFRALRRLWARVERACDLVPKPLHLHGETAWRTMTRAAAPTNFVRGALACFAAAISGADGVTVLPFTMAVGLPDGFARRVARNTGHVLAEEVHLWRVADPVAGAGLFEAVTDALCQAAWAEFQAIEGEGRAVASLARGALQARIGSVRKEREARTEDERDALVGVSVFPAEEPAPRVLAPFRPKAGRVASGPLRAIALPSRRAEDAFRAEPEETA